MRFCGAVGPLREETKSNRPPRWFHPARPDFAWTLLP